MASEGYALNGTPRRDRDVIIAQSVRLVRAAELLGIPVWATEQYPEGLGPTVYELASLIPHRPAKTTFHPRDGFCRGWGTLGRFGCGLGQLHAGQHSQKHH